MGNAIYDEKSPITGSVTFILPEGTTMKGVGPANYDPWRVDAIAVSNTDSIDHVLDVGWFDNYTVGALSRLASVVVPAGAGDGTTPPLDVLAALAGPYINGIILAATLGIGFTLAVAMGSGATLTIWVQGGAL